MSRDPVPISESLAGVVESLRGPAGRTAGSSSRAVGGVFGRWNEIVGEVVAGHVQPVKLDGDRLVVEVDDPAWATQLRFLESDLKSRLRATIGASVERFEIRVARR